MKSGGPRKGLGTFATEAEAVAILDAARARLGIIRSNAAALGFANFGRSILDERELDGFKGVAKERDRFEFHLAECSISAMSVAGDEIKPQHIADLGRELMRKQASDKRGRRPLGKATVDRCMSFVSTIMSAAVERGLRPNNPCVGIRVKRRKNESKNKQKWTFLTPDEMRAIYTCKAIPYPERIMMMAAWGSGIREGEFYWQELSDLHVGANEPDPHLWVRYGSKDAPPKSGKERKVRLFGDALFAFREWLRIRSSYLELPKGTRDPSLIFPTRTGCARQSGKPLGNGWKDKATGRWVDRVRHYMGLAGVPMRPYLHWHALRHTCASALIQGRWGRRWTLEEIKEQLGHSSIVVTQMYAHLADDTMADAARGTSGGGYVVGSAGLEPATNRLKADCATIAPQALDVSEVGTPSSRAPPMAASANDLTLCDLLRDLLPLELTRNHRGDTQGLGPSDVVKLQDNRVLLAAVNAGMFGEVGVNLLAQLQANPLVPLARLKAMGFSVEKIPSATTFLAAGLPPVGAPGRAIEESQRSSNAARGTLFYETHPVEVGTPGTGYEVVTEFSGGCSANAAITQNVEGLDGVPENDQTHGLKGRGIHQRISDVTTSVTPEKGPVVTTIAATLADLLARGEYANALELARAVADGTGPATMHVDAVRNTATALALPARMHPNAPGSGDR